MTRELSSHDSDVLDMIFDITKIDSNFKDATKPVIDELPADIKDIEEENTSNVQKSKLFEIEGIKLAEQEKYDEALQQFNESIKMAPHRPSAWNNRAQAYRLIEKDDEALNDLEEALKLCGNNYPATKCRAYCQRGLIRRRIGEEEGAKDDFNESAKLGSKFARQQLVEMNPYAQLCNQMLSEMMKKCY